MSDVNLWTMFTKTLSNEEVTKIKVIDSDDFNNFYVDDFCNWNHLRFQNHVWNCHLLKFKIWTVQILSNKKMTKIKVVDSDVFNNFYVYDFLFEIVMFLKSCLKLPFIEIQNLNFFKFENLKSFNGWKVVEHITIYNFYFGHLFIWQNLNSSNFEFQKMTASNLIFNH